MFNLGKRRQNPGISITIIMIIVFLCQNAAWTNDISISGQIEPKNILLENFLAGKSAFQRVEKYLADKNEVDFTNQVTLIEDLTTILRETNKLTRLSDKIIEQRLKKINKKIKSKNLVLEEKLGACTLSSGSEIRTVAVKLNGKLWKMVYLNVNNLTFWEQIDIGIKNRKDLNWLNTPDVERVWISDVVDFSGIDFYADIDKDKKVIYQEGTSGHPGYLLLQYCPRSEAYSLYRISTTGNGKVEKDEVNYNARSAVYHKYSNRIEKEGFRRLFQEKLNIIVPDKPLGFSEIRSIIDKIQQRNDIGPQQIKKGDFILVEEGSVSNLTLVEVAGTEIEYKGTKSEKMCIYHQEGSSLGDFIVGINANYGFHSKLNSTGVWFHYKGELIMGEQIDQPKKAWLVTKEEIKQICKYKPAERDPALRLYMSRAEFCVYAALQGMQYERWGHDNIDRLVEEILRERHRNLYIGEGDSRGWKPIPQHPVLKKKAEAAKISQFKREQKKKQLEKEMKKSLEEQYAGISQENYARALDILINRFGKKVFAEIVQDLLKMHLVSLHVSTHRDNICKPHSDISAIDIEAAPSVIRGVHPCPKDMLGGITVNVTSLFGDVDFWHYLIMKQPDLYNQFVDYLQAFPKQFTLKSDSLTAIVHDPVAVIKEYFPQTFRKIQDGGRTDFDSTVSPAVTWPEPSFPSPGILPEKYLKPQPEKPTSPGGSTTASRAQELRKPRALKPDPARAEALRAKLLQMHKKTGHSMPARLKRDLSETEEQGSDVNCSI